LLLIETKLGRTQQSPTIAARLANPLHLAVRLSTRTFRGLDISVALSVEFGGSWRIGAHVWRQPLTALPLAIPAAIHKRGGEATYQRLMADRHVIADDGAATPTGVYDRAVPQVHSGADRK